MAEPAFEPRNLALVFMLLIIVLSSFSVYVIIAQWVKEIAQIYTLKLWFKPRQSDFRAHIIFPAFYQTVIPESMFLPQYKC